MKKVKVTLEFISSLEKIIDEESLKNDFNNDINEYFKWLVSVETSGILFEYDPEFVKAEIIEND